MFEYLFPNYFIFYATDFGTTWLAPQFTCTLEGTTAVPGDAVPGCMIPGYYAV